MHNRNPWYLVLALALLLMMAAPVLAQTDAEPLDIGGGYSVTLPEGWTRVGRMGQGILIVSSNASITLYGPEAIDELTQRGMRGSPRIALASAYQSLYGVPMDDTTSIQNQRFAGMEAAVWYYLQGSTQEGVFAVVALDEPTTFFAIDITTPLDRLDTEEGSIGQIVGSLSTEGAAASSAADTSGDAVETCFVSTGDANSAHLRVGPGFNRSSVAFLPAGTDFEVIGQATADDDSVWFKLDKAEAAPQSAASEIWVLSEEVETSGGCNAVATVGGSPIIPIIAAPPAAPETQSGQADAGGGSTDAAPAAAGTLPLGGTWTVTFARMSNASCEGYENITLATHEIWENWDESDYVWTASLVANGSTSFTFDGDVYRYNGGNEFVGNWDFDQAGLNTYLYWHVISPTSMNGTMTGNVIDGGVACSGTTSFSAVHR
ncbi:MAG: hypothetical protein IT320_21255 [Anaerolineae bacterium]|nr:hypothetical protein [Anaerolineae bacterium]